MSLKIKNVIKEEKQVGNDGCWRVFYQIICNLINKNINDVFAIDKGKPKNDDNDFNRWLLDKLDEDFNKVRTISHEESWTKFKNYIQEDSLVTFSYLSFLRCLEWNKQNHNYLIELLGYHTIFATRTEDKFSFYEPIENKGCEEIAEEDVKRKFDVRVKFEELKYTINNTDTANDVKIYVFK